MKMRWIVVAMVYGYLTAFAQKGSDFSWIFPALMLLVAWVSVRHIIRMESGWRLVGAWLLMLSIVGYANARSGLLYFQDAIGPQVSGVPLAWPLLLLPITVCATVVAERVTASPWKRALRGAVVSFAASLLIIPVAFTLGIWGYRFDGMYYHTPWMQFVIWSLIGVLSVNVAGMVSRAKPLPLQAIDGAYLLTAFMVGIALGYQLALAALFGLWFMLYVQRSKAFL